MKDLESKNFIQSCLCDEKGFIKAEFLVSGTNGIEIILDESCENILIEELNKFIKFYGLEVEIDTIKINYKFFNDTSKSYVLANGEMLCDINIFKDTSDTLLTNEEFELNILLLGQFLFSCSDSGRHRPHDLGMNKTHVSFKKGCFRGQEVIARTEHLSKKKKEIIPIEHQDETNIDSKKIKTLKEISSGENIFKLVSFIPN